MGETLAQNLVCFLHHHESLCIDLHDQTLQFRHLLLFYHSQDYLHVITAIGALTVKVRSTPVQLQADLMGNTFMLRRNDQCHLRVVKTVDHRINHLSADKNRHTTVERLGHIPEYQTCQNHYRCVKDDVERADGDVFLHQLQQPHNDI